jgi:hypothetical protein
VILALLLIAEAQRLAVIAEPVDAELMKRVRGHVGDLSWRVEARETKTGTIGDAPSRARAMIDEHRADVVIWLERSQGGFELTIGEARGGRTMSRHVSERGVLGGSASREAVALIVRYALRAVDQGEVSDWVEEAPAIEDEPPKIAEAAIREEDAPVPVVPLEPGPEISLGWRAAIDGETSGLHSIVARAGWILGDAGSFGVEGSFGAASSLSDELATVRLARHSIALFAALPIVNGWLEMSVALDGGLFLFRRVTEPRRADVEATPPALKPALFAGAELRARIPLFAGLGLEASAGADLAPGAPLLRVQKGDLASDRNDLSAFEPRVGLAISWRR